MLFPGEIVVDNFAGGGGASLGIEQAIGRPINVAINHDPEAIAMHRANHPATLHFNENLWSVDPEAVLPGRPIGLAWFSPDCTHHSKAKGAKPRRDKRIRALAWVVLRWAARRRPRVIMLENVEEFADWGPLTRTGRPCKKRKGWTFQQFVSQLRDLGYAVEWRELRACDYGAPTIRKRLFLIARRDGRPIAWPSPTHAAPCSLPILPPYRTAAECIDWSLDCPSIFDRKRPLKDATLRRIANGVRRFVIEAAEPFIVPVTRTGRRSGHPVSEPVRTVTTAKGGEFALVSPTLIQTGYGERPGQAPRVPGLGKPLGTVVAGGSKHALVAAFLAQHNTGMTGHEAPTPLSTITGRGTQQQVVTSNLIKLQKGCAGQDLREPAHTVTTRSHFAEVRAFLLKYYGTATGQDIRDPLHSVTARARFGLVMVHGEPWQIVDIGMRMLQPRELYRAQGFPDSYVIDFEYEGRPLTKTSQIRMCGNSVSPPNAAALVRANFGTPADVGEVAA